MSRWSAFWDGVASLFDLGGVSHLRRSQEILQRSDAEALRSDWEAVGGYLWGAIERFENELFGDKRGEHNE